MNFNEKNLLQKLKHLKNKNMKQNCRNDYDWNFSNYFYADISDFNWYKKHKLLVKLYCILCMIFEKIINLR